MPLTNPPVLIKDEGSQQGSVDTINFVGSFVSASVTGSEATVTLGLSGQAVNDIAYFDGTNWVRLAAGNAGGLLQTMGTTQAPKWVLPIDAFASGLYNEMTSNLSSPFNTVLPTLIAWYDQSNPATRKMICSKTITWNTTTQKPTQEVWKVYASDGTTVLTTITDVYDYSGTFTTKTRTIV